MNSESSDAKGTMVSRKCSGSNIYEYAVALVDPASLLCLSYRFPNRLPACVCVC